MKKSIRIEDQQDRIYQKMSARKKLAVLDMFYRTGQILNKKTNNDQKYAYHNLNLHRQSS